MKKRGVACIIGACIISLCNMLPLHGQTADTNVYIGVLSGRKETVELCVHDIYSAPVQGAYILDSINSSNTILGMTDADGKKDLYFPENHQYTVNIEKKGFKTKKVSFTVPKSSLTMKIVDVQLDLERENIIPQPEDNKIYGISSGTISYVGDGLSFNAEGGGMDDTSPIKYDVRYRPVSWRLDANGAGGYWNKPPYKATIVIKDAGEHILYTYFQEELYDGTSWVSKKSLVCIKTRILGIEKNTPVPPVVVDPTTPVVPPVIHQEINVLKENSNHEQDDPLSNMIEVIPIEDIDPGLQYFLSKANENVENPVLQKQVGINITPILWGVACLLIAIIRYVYIKNKDKKA